jgi:antibiotic biosynthesis monooxygenase (ABM) superfamily enzyme
MSYTQIMELTGVRDPEALQDHVAGWDADQNGVAPGYLGARVLADQDGADRFLVVVDFSSEEEARRNSDRSETSAWAERLRALADDEPTYRNLESVYATER